MNNVLPDEVEKFSRASAAWWDESGSFAPLHQLNRARLMFITNEVAGNKKVSLRGKRVLDIGCGGGLLAEPLARLGAEVIGLDASAESLAVARDHAALSGLDIDYRCILLEELDETDFDLVLAMEIVEHLPDVPAFIALACKKIKLGGHFFLSTINRTPESFLVAIVGAEYILQKLPKGTHEFEKFVRPAELESLLSQAQMSHIKTQGATFNPLTGRFFLSRHARVNYFMAARKPA